MKETRQRRGNARPRNEMHEKEVCSDSITEDLNERLAKNVQRGIAIVALSCEKIRFVDGLVVQHVHIRDSRDIRVVCRTEDD